MLRFYSLSGIRYIHPEQDLFIVLFIRGDGQTDMPLFRVFRRVGQEVKENLAHPHLIPDKAVGDITVDIGIKTHRLFLKPRADNINRVVDQG